MLKRHKPTTYSDFQWLEDTTAALQGSLACTDWSIFDEVISDYIKFCMTTTIPVTTVKKCPTSRP